jgi:anti-anti-sigma regulatory factor
MALVGVNDRVSDLFEITRVRDLFLTFPNVWDAIEALANSAHA